MERNWRLIYTLQNMLITTYSSKYLKAGAIAAANTLATLLILFVVHSISSGHTSLQLIIIIFLSFSLFWLVCLGLLLWPMDTPCVIIRAADDKRKWLPNSPSDFWTGIWQSQEKKTVFFVGFLFCSVVHSFTQFALVYDCMCRNL